MLRVPQGWIESMDHLNIHTRCLLAGLERASKIVDDACLMPRSASEGYYMAYKVLIAAISKTINFSPGKFILSPLVTFAGLQLRALPSGEVIIHPDKKRLDHLINLPNPKSKEDVLSLLGRLGYC